MGAPTALDHIRTGTPDGTNGTKLPSVPLVEDSSLEAPTGIALSDAIPNGPSAHRSSGGVDSATDMSTTDFAGTSGANLDATNNRGAIAIWVTFATAGASCVLQPVYYDGADAPMALGPALTFVAGPQRVSASGDYMTPVQLVDTYGFKQFRVYKTSVSSGNITVYAQPL